jgi:hypothetical protein
LQFDLTAMYRNKAKPTIACLIGTIILALSTPTQSVGQGADASRERAVALWEEAIRAKGGRGRLHSVQNLLISSTVDVRDQSGSSVMETERLYAMPGKAWLYTFTPESHVSVDVTVINNERDFCMRTLSPKASGVPPLSHCVPTTPYQYLIQDPVIYLMETNWLRPVPVGLRTERKGMKQLDVIETKVGKLRVDFYLDRKTRLPIRIVTDCFGAIGQPTGRHGLMTIELEDYVAIDGILMPRFVTREPEGEAPVGEVFRRDTECAGYRFNVDYDPKIFEFPASKKVKRSDWKQQRHE